MKINLSKNQKSQIKDIPAIRDHHNKKGINDMVLKKAGKLARKLKRKGITFETLKDYAQQLGYPILFYNSPAGAASIKAYELSSLVQTREAFTLDAEIKAIFISQNVDENKMLFLILHELGHIELGHTSEFSQKDPYVSEMEASTFAYKVLNPRRKGFSVSFLCATAITAFLIGLLFSFVPIKQSTLFAPSRVETVMEKYKEKSAQIFYITESGTKYHLKSCQYVTSDATPVTYSKIQYTHKPCRICKP